MLEWIAVGAEECSDRSHLVLELVESIVRCLTFQFEIVEMNLKAKNDLIGILGDIQNDLMAESILESSTFF